MGSHFVLGWYSNSFMESGLPLCCPWDKCSCEHCILVLCCEPCLVGCHIVCRATRKEKTEAYSMTLSGISLL